MLLPGDVYTLLCYLVNRKQGQYQYVSRVDLGERLDAVFFEVEVVVQLQFDNHDKF